MKQNTITPLFNEHVIRERIKALGAEISADYMGKDLLCVGILKGSVIFLADLVRAISVPLQIEFMAVKSYDGKQSTGNVQITADLTSDIKGRHVLIIEDIVDTGMTLDCLLNTLQVREPQSLKVCALLTKPEAHIMKHNIDYVGFQISNEFVVGYGLDYNGAYRNLPYIGQLHAD